MRHDVVNRKCRVNQSEVEAMALTLSQLSRSLADLKSEYSCTYVAFYNAVPIVRPVHHRTTISGTFMYK